MSAIMAGAGLGLSIYQTIAGIHAQNQANRANKQRYQMIMNLLRNQGDASKADIAQGAKDERGTIAQSLVGRGLYNTSVLDSMNNQSLASEARSKARVDQDTASQLAGVTERVTDAAPQQNFGQYAQLGMSSAQLLADSFKPPAPKAISQPSWRYSNFGGNDGNMFSQINGTGNPGFRMPRPRSSVPSYSAYLGY